MTVCNPLLVDNIIYGSDTYYRYVNIASSLLKSCLPIFERDPTIVQICSINHIDLKSYKFADWKVKTPCHANGVFINKC